MKTNRLKTAILLAAFILSLPILLTSCLTNDGNIGPQGPPGNANVKSYTYTIRPSEWIETNDFNLWYHDEACDYVTPEIVDYGAVLFYLKSVNSGDVPIWLSLPSTSLYRDQNGTIYTTEYQPWHTDYRLTIQYLDTHPTDPRAPTWNCVIKVIVIADYPGYVTMMKNIDTKDYNQVKEAFNLPD